MKRPLAYITAHWGDNEFENTENAAKYCRLVYEAGFSPVCPLLFLPLFLKDSIPQEHKDGIDMARDYLRRASVLVVCGGTVDEAMKNDIAVVKAFSQSAGSYKKYSAAVEDNAAYYVDWMRDNQKYMCLWQSIIPSVLVTVLPTGLFLLAHNSLTAADFLTIVVLSLGITAPVVSAMSFMDDLAVVGTNVGEISAILDAPELVRPQNRIVFDNQDIELKNVSFSYDKADENVLHDVSLKINSGTVTALVGPSGSGKSTIAKLIAGFWDVSAGSIRIGGHDIREIPLEQLNQQIAYVSQDNYLFDRTVRENIRMGRLDATDQEVEAVAKAAGCDEFIRNLEHGYDTVCGSGGGHLSGGEKQRISIARAMLKNAPIIILDEATASIDPENEALIQRAISALTVGKTLIVIPPHPVKII